MLSSQWRRCRETAELLGLGPVEDLPALNSFFEDRSREEAQTRALRSFLRQQPDAPRLVLVTHQVNITALTDVFPASGEIVVVDVGPTGRVTVLDEILIRP